MLRLFGCPVFAHINDGKLAPQAVKCMFLGYASTSKGYRMWCPNYKKVIQSRDVTFNENAMLSFGKKSIVSFAGTGDREDASRTIETDAKTVTAQSGVVDHYSKEVQPTKPSSSINQPQVEDDYSIARYRPKREIRKPARYVDSEGLVAYALTVAEEIPEGTEPSTYTEAISFPSLSNWVLAMQ